jgi:superoxide dismutase
MYVEFSQFINIDTVSYGCVRQWVLRLGLGILQEPVEKRMDWVYITDFSIQLGKERCLLILGVSRQSLIENGYELRHKQVRVLDIFVQEHFDAQKVYERLMITKQKTGTPYQIISDKGRDICKGIEMFCGENKSVIPTYDITHMIGIVLKHHIENDERWKNLQADLLCLTQQVKQTELSFLRPIAMSTKARWLNLNKEVEYLEKIYQYAEKGDFSLISEDIKIGNHEEVFEILKDKCRNKHEEKRLAKELESKFTNQESAIELLTKKGIKDTGKIEFKDAGGSRYTDKFSILNKHKDYFNELKQVNHIAENIKCIIREKGLSLDTLQEIETIQNKITYPIVNKIFNEINNNLQTEHSKCGIDKTPLLCCSEIIESIFGKFKMKSKQTVGGIYQSVLSIALICSEITPEKIKKILSGVKMPDVDKWFSSMSGISNLAKRRIAFG